MSTTDLIAPVACYHCGEKCDSDTIQVEDKSFCCEGCKTVYNLLSEHDMCTYYSLDEHAGSTQNLQFERKRFDYLIDKDVENNLIDFRNGSLASVTFFVPAIHCTSCVWLLENLGNIDSGIKKGTVNFLKRTVTILYEENQTSLRNVVELLTTIGYEPNLKLEQLNGDKKANITSIDRSLWLKLGVAGFAFGNIMLFSFPEYLKMDQSGSTEWFGMVFNGLNIALALPVLLYSSMDYLKSAWAAVSQRGVNLDVPITMGIIALFSRSLYEIISGTGPGYLDSFTGFIFFLLVGKVVQKKTFDRLSFDRDFRSYLPISVIRLQNGTECSVPVNKIDIGDHILIRNQELIPADSVLYSESAEIDYSFISGEQEPLTVTKGERVYAGGKIAGGTAEMLVSKTVEHSYLTSLWENEAFTETNNDKQITSFADVISPWFTLTVVAIASLSLLIWLTIDASQAFTIFTAVLIVACPCALALSTPFTLGAAVNILSLNGLYVKSTSVVETLSKVTTFVFDKTGTLTESARSQVQFKSEQELTSEEMDLICSVARQSIHPLSKTIYTTFSSGDRVLPESFEELPGMGIKATIKHQEYALGSRRFIQGLVGNNNGSEYTNKPPEGSAVYVAIDGSYRGYFEFRNKIRNGVPELLKRLSARFELHLLSGDNETEKSRFTEMFSGWKSLSFNQSPSDKLERIGHLKQNDHKVVMIGDGLNDAGALKASNFGIAISDDMSSFSPACDAIIESSSVGEIDNLIEFSQAAFTIILWSFGISLLYNITGLAFAVTGHLSPLVAAILMPLSSVSVMAFTNIATRIKAKNKGLHIWA